MLTRNPVARRSKWSVGVYLAAPQRLLRIGQVLGTISLLFGAIGLVGAMLLATILAGAGALGGLAILGVGTFLVVLGIGRRAAGRFRLVLIALGIIGLSILLLRPLVNAFAVLSSGVAVVIMVAWGALWVVAGVLLSRTSCLATPVSGGPMADTPHEQR